MRVLDPDVLAEFRARGRCEWCGEVCPVAPHHLYAVGAGGGSRLDLRLNLAALCVACHDGLHARNRDPSREELWELVARRHALTVAELRGVLDLYRRASR